MESVPAGFTVPLTDAVKTSRIVGRVCDFGVGRFGRGPILDCLFPYRLPPTVTVGIGWAVGRNRGALDVADEEASL
jgi:hypothetical protein